MDLQKIWLDAQKQIADRVSSVSFDLWIKTLTPEAFEDGVFILAALSGMAKQQALNERHFPHIVSALKACAPIVENVRIIDAVEKEARDKKNIPASVKPAADTEQHSKSALLQINPNMTFANFIIGKSNEVVAAAAEAVAKNPGKKINPLFIYGNSGLGKTHLLNAIANYIFLESPGTVIALATSEKFTNDYVSTMAHKSNPTAAFREKYRTADILLIDDIQFIRDKKGTQEEFFHTFNDLIQNGKQIIITSDRHPDEMPTLEERMRSRFKSGLIQDITTPDIEMRMAILQKKAGLENYRLSDEVCTFIARYAMERNLNIRDMEGNLFKVIFYAGLRNKLEPTLQDCYDALKDVQDNTKHQTTADIIIAQVCKYFNITRDDIIGKRRNREFVEPRMFAIYLITEFLNIPLINIGQLLGGRDHTTVMHARNKISSQLTDDRRTKRIVSDISKLIKSE
jgi:chromosomal replication initiator protein